MFLDAHKVAEGTVLRGTVCVIGAGVAGITLALEFERRGIDCIMLESGGLVPDEATRDLYRGENIGLPSVFCDGCRSRFFGGAAIAGADGAARFGNTTWSGAIMYRQRLALQPSGTPAVL